jgi:hypothetical protein
MSKTDDASNFLRQKSVRDTIIRGAAEHAIPDAVIEDNEWWRHQLPP